MRYKLHLFLVILLKILVNCSLADSNSKDYALLAQRQMQYDIKIEEIQVDFVNDRYSDMINVIVHRQKRVLDEIYQTDEHLTFMQAVNSTYRHCIQRYKSTMYTKVQAQEKFNACSNAADIKFQQLTLDVETPLNLAKHTANVQLPLAVENCGAFPSNGTQQEECVVAKVERESETFNDNLNNCQDNLEVNLGLSSFVTRRAMECSFKAEKEVLVKIGKTLQYINNCLEEKNLSAISAM